jgi:membrane fusion protein, multidrug efflux system
VQRSSSGAYVYVLKPDRTVTARKVTLGVADGDDVEVTGVAVGEQVVVDGADRLREGARVEPQVRSAS